MAAAANPDKTRQWSYAPLGERAVAAGASLGAAALFGFTLTQVFNPVAVGVAVAYGAGRVAYESITGRGPKAVQKMIDQGYIVPLPREHAHVQKLTDELAQTMGMAPHTAYIATEKVPRAMTPWILRWMLAIPEIRKKIMENTAGAASRLDIILMTEDFLKKATPDEARFVIAHEMAHAKNEDSDDLRTYGKKLKKYISQPLWLGLGVMMLGGLLGVSGVTLPPLLAAGGMGVMMAGLTLGTASIAATLGLNYANRVVERRADRNAMYLTRDGEAAISFLRKAETKNRIPPERPAYLEVLTHPSFHPRVANLRAAFTEAAAYPAPSTAVHVRAVPEKLEQPRIALTF